jgi:branched-chain amino acid transport system substrate-binding protein
VRRESVIRRVRIAASSLGALLLGFGLLSIPSAGAASASAPGVTATTVKVGILGDLTGPAASTFQDAPQAIEARFKQINAAGGVNGRKITWTVADTTSSPSGAETAAKDLVQTQGAFLVAPDSALLFGGAPYLNQAGVPVLGYPVDGPEWYEQPNTNMFAFSGNDSPSIPGYTDGGFWKSLGAKKVSFVASNTPSSTSGINPFKDDMAKDGLSVCDDYVVPLGAVSFTTYAAECSCVLSSSLAMSTALRQQGLTDVKLVYAAGPDNQIYASSADEAAAKGAYFVGGNYSTPGGKAMLAGLKKYDPSYAGGVPDLATSSGWEVANLVIEGLQVAGKNPTRQSLITNLRQVTGWTDDGLLPAAVSFVHFGVAPATECSTYTQFVNNKFVPYPKSGKPFCGKLIPGSGTPPAT